MERRRRWVTARQTRRRAMFSLFLFLLWPACKTENRNDPLTPDSQVINRLIQHMADSLHAEFGVSLYDLQTGYSFNFNENRLMHAASTMKVPVMIELFRQADAGKFSLGDSITIRNAFHSIVDSSFYALTPADDGETSLYEHLGEKMPIRELVVKMITWSSNLATNLLIELVDARAVTRTMRELGAPSIQVLRGVEDIKAYRQGLSNRTSAYDMQVILRAIAAGKAASPAACDEMIEILKHQHFRERIPAGIPDSVAVANKTGMITAIDHDCAIVFPPGRKPYVLVVLTKGIADANQSGHAIAAISRQFYQALVGTPAQRG